MSSDRGWFESEEDYRDRTAREANERTIEESTGSAPSKGWLESDDAYRDRIEREANEHVIENSTGSAPTKGWLESDDDYRDRLSREANERIVEDSTGSSPSRGWLESDDDYEVRLRKEANEQTIERLSGSAPNKGWVEDDHDYRSRIAHEARELRAHERSNNDETSGSCSEPGESTSYSPTESTATPAAKPSSTGVGCLIAALVIGLFGILTANTGNQSNSSKRSSQQSRPNEVLRFAERVRVEKVLPGEWILHNQTDRGQPTVVLFREGNTFHGEYRAGRRREPLSGQIESDNRLRLVNDRQYCKIVQGGTWYEGAFSQQAWLQAGTNDDILLVSFYDGETPVMMTRAGSKGPKN